MSELPGMWDESDLSGGWADTEDCDDERVTLVTYPSGIVAIETGLGLALPPLAPTSDAMLSREAYRQQARSARRKRESRNASA